MSGTLLLHRRAVAGAGLALAALWLVPEARATEPTPAALDPRTLVADLPFRMPSVALPRIPAHTERITDHGARGDGEALDTEAIARAIAACERAGGGRVVVPRGVFLTGPIELRSRIELHLERGALLLFSPRFEDYPLVRTSYEGAERVRARSPLWAYRADDVAITGEGIVDGSGQAWRPVKKSKTTEAQWQALVSGGGVVDAAGTTWWPSPAARDGARTVRELEARGALPAEYAAAREYLRPVLVSLVECRRVLLDGPTFRNSPAWGLHPLLCEDVVVRNVTVQNPWYAQNGDGIDVESCRRVVVHDCRFDVGDDAICLKSGRDEAGRRRGRPTEDVLVTDSTVEHGHGGFTIGSEMSGGVRNVLVARCTLLGTDVGLRFKTARGRGGVVERIWVRDVQMTDIPTDAIGFSAYYGGSRPEEPSEAAGSAGQAHAVDEGTPQIRDIVLSRILCRGAGRAARLEGLPEMPLRGVVLDDVRISAQRGLSAVDAEALTLRGVEVAARTGPALSLRDSRDVAIEGGAAARGTGVFLRVDGAKSHGVALRGVDVTGAATAVETGVGVPTEAVVRQPAAAAGREPIVWTLDDLQSIGGHPATILGRPVLAATATGPAIEFDGAGDGLLLDTNPVEGLAQFTVEVLFEPSPNGGEEQRFLHVSESGRLMLETRLLPDGRWALDTYLRAEAPGLALLDRRLSHPSGSWHTVALTYDGTTMTSFVDGVRELSGEVAFPPPSAGRTTIGVRQNRVSWFAGRIGLIRVSPRALPAGQLLRPPQGGSPAR